MTTRYACYNIRYGMGIDGEYDPARCVAAVADADIIALQEVTRGFPANSGADMVAEICGLLPGRFCALGMSTDIDAGSSVENGQVVERRFQFGNMILSRWPIISIRNHLLPRYRSSGSVNLQRGALEAVIAAPQGATRVIGVHLDHIDAGERLAQIEALREFVAGYPRRGGAVTGMSQFGHDELPVARDVVVMGDFNMKPGSAEYLAMTGTEEPLLVDISAGDPGHSFFDPNEAEPRQRLDFIFADSDTAARASGFRIDREAAGSDHLPLHFLVN